MNVFGDLDEEYTSLERAKIVLVPVPYDGTSTYGKGADKGPSALIEATPILNFMILKLILRFTGKAFLFQRQLLKKKAPRKL